MVCSGVYFYIPTPFSFYQLLFSRGKKSIFSSRKPDVALFTASSCPFREVDPLALFSAPTAPALLSKVFQSFFGRGTWRETLHPWDRSSWWGTSWERKKHHSYTRATFLRILPKSGFVTNTKRHAPYLMFGFGDFFKKQIQIHSICFTIQLQPESKFMYLEILLLFVNRRELTVKDLNSLTVTWLGIT